MENLSRPVRSVKIPLTVAIPDYLRDHCYDGHIVLPAAEALQILAKSLPDDLPRCDPRLQERGEFAHLLPLDADADTFSAFHEIAFSPDGCRLSRLTTLRSGRQTQWTRSIEHVSVYFLPYFPLRGQSIALSPKNLQCALPGSDSEAHRPQGGASRQGEGLFVSAPLLTAERAGLIGSAPGQGEIRDRAPVLPQENRGSVPNFPRAAREERPSFRFPCQRLYADLVPFGSAYHNVVGEVSLTPDGASAEVSGGDFPDAIGPLGSPFPIDAAMHVACAWGQRYRNCVAFPVGFDRREIILSTSAGETYLCRVFPLRDEGAILRFNIGLFSKDDRPAEIILGLRMRDISGGRLKPPTWVRKGI